MYFHHVGQHGYSIDQGCFKGSSFVTAKILDPRLIYIYQQEMHHGLDRNCSNVTNHVICSGSLQVAIGFKRQFLVALGFPCGHERALDVTFNISVTGYDDGEVPCTDWSQAFDELKPSIPSALNDAKAYCQTLYPQFSRWNGLGFSQYDFMNTYQYYIVGLPCYEHFNELVCSLLLPRCVNKTVYLSCADMCKELVEGCTKSHVYYNVSCTSLKSKSDPTGKHCNYKPCVCNEQILLPDNGRILHFGGGIAPNVTTIGCRNLYELSKPSFSATCGYDGFWHYSTNTGVSCDLILAYVIAVVIGIMMCFFTAMLAVIYRFRFGLQLKAFKYCSCCMCLCKCCKRLPDIDKEYDVFQSLPC